MGYLARKWGLDPVDNAAYRTLFPLSGRGVAGDTDPALIVDAGLRFVRVDTNWDLVETFPGVFDWSALDARAGRYVNLGVRIVWVVSYANPIYYTTHQNNDVLPFAPHPNTLALVNQTQWDAYARFARLLIDRYRGHGHIFEIWNEPNLLEYWFDLHAVDATEYASAAMAAVQAMRRNAEREWIILGGMSTFDSTYLTDLYAVSGFDQSFFDGVAIHPYRMDTPESTASDWTWLSGFISNPAVQMICSEWGYNHGYMVNYTPTLPATSDPSYPGLFEAAQSDYYERIFGQNEGSGVPLSIIFNSQDGTGTDDNYGLLRVDGSKKPCYFSIHP